ncbi:sensor histidine kinase (plasmid) [Agrobacterium sp. rho-13.3]|uniref:sensor histidine kinase n=1 Tax=Agrobacterium sp. rho-13.3 TaxID=3072980 RepID=UPI002A12521B|nr:sensor histidine kinase [Agrobacterium sp. rho-13.3]MDX8311545.1 sensor histidine kinase [Agrobacterium sp. rho-13.3]
MTKPKQIKFRPYARLLTMLGDQLIKNERVALVELVKNAYDADASWVKVTFDGFDGEFQGNANSKIIIEDDGVGMTRETIENHWANPATPMKLVGKKNSQTKTKKGRIIQGEKGIGRFALLKIGRDITITTRPARSDSEFILKLDVSKYDTDFLDDNDEGLFLDAISMTLGEQSPAEKIRKCKIELGVTSAIRKPQGTRIEISHLAGAWSTKKVKDVYEDLTRVQSLFDLDKDDNKDGDADTPTKRVESDPFELLIYRGDRHEPFGEQLKSKLAVLLRQNSVFTIEGQYLEQERVFNFTINGIEHKLNLSDPHVMALPVFWERFGKAGEVLQRRGTECGPFSFRFYVFDLSNLAIGKHQLDDSDKKLIKEHRIYLYRDGIRVYPYGDPGDDWLHIDIRRGTVRASEFLSNDQVVGVVDITQQSNPDLQDKTSREGLVELGNATEDFRALLQTFLAWIRKDPYFKYRQKLGTKDDVKIYKAEAVQRSLDDAIAANVSGDIKAASVKLAQASRDYKAERRYLVQRAETTEHLAGVGLSVETASHDLMLAMGSAVRQLNSLIHQTQRKREIDPQVLQRELATIQGLLTFIESQMKDMQLLFRSTKQRRKALHVREVLTKVERLFAGPMDRADIEYVVTEEGGPLKALTTEAVLLQTFLNLFDNSVHWLELHAKPRRIHILLSGERQLMVFGDNGPGIPENDRPYLFEPFFSGKGEEGRGLGLYIARQLLDRHGYTIELSDRADAIESGANFTVSFIKE